MERTKKGTVRNFIYEAMQESRTPLEVVQYIKKTYNRDISLRSVYYHINQVQKKKDPCYDLRIIPHTNGKKYCFVSKNKVHEVEQSYLQWLIEKYSLALHGKDEIQFYHLHKDLIGICAWKIINDEAFINFLWKQAKTHPCIYRADQHITLDIWHCLSLITLKHQLSKHPQNKHLQKIDLFFRDIVLDQKRFYALERLEAFHHLVILKSPWTIFTMFKLLEDLNPALKIKFSPSSNFTITELELFQGGMQSQMSQYASSHPEDCRKKLFSSLETRAKQFGKNEEGRELILNLIEETRHFLTGTIPIS